MKTYHQYQSESKQAEQKLRIIQQQVAKIKSAKKQKNMEKRVKKVDINGLKNINIDNIVEQRIAG